MEWIRYLIPPVLGAAIGYVTNFLALKMLFSPKKAIYIGKWRVPFTPGIIPKRKNELAHAIGELVAARFFTEDDIRAFFLSEEMKQTVANGIASGLDSLISGQTVRQAGEAVIGSYKLEEIQIQAQKAVYLEVRNTVMHSDIFERVEAGAGYMIRKKLSGTILQRLVSKQQMDSVSKTVSYEMQKYMHEHMEELLLPMIAKKSEELLDSGIEENLESFGVTQEMVYQAGLAAYGKFVEEALDQVVRVFDIAKLTEEKIIQMDAKEVEALSNRVIRREMQAVIYLGAILGAVIGLVNLLFL
ncbi:MAG: DUF445 family protein [Eubacterium sp.]|jgi:Uncharacterized protein conserved in bacteria|nr:DUF445 family protein [Eubacterium sp.]